MRRRQFVWGAILLMLGGLMLANESGIRLPNGVSPLDLFWPLLLFLGGVWVLFGAYFRGKLEVEDACIELRGARESSIRIDHGAGELKIHSGAAGPELVRGTFVGGLDRKVTRKGDVLEVRLRPVRDLLDFPLPGPGSRLDWDVALNADAPLALSFNLGANKSDIDLHDLMVKSVKLDTGASETRLRLPARGRCDADLDLGAASLEVIIPEGVSARIRASVGLADLRIDETRFPRLGGYYQSADFATASNAVEMTIDAGAASIKVA